MQRIQVVDYPDAMVARASTQLTQHFGALTSITAQQQLQFGEGQAVEHVLVSPFSDPFGLDWLLVVVIPEADFMGGIYAGTRKTIMTCIGILALTLVFGVVYSAQISKPMRALSEQVQQIQQFKLDNTFDVGSRVSEVGSLADALARMQTGLSSFRRFVPAHLVRRILELGEEASLGGEARTVTILFSDLQGYSTLIEHLTPETVIAFMNLYFDAMEEVISDNHGVVLELQGDAILAVFGTPDDVPDHATAATRSAMAMREQFAAMNTHFKQTGYADIGGFQGTLELHHRIGVHTGRVVAGIIGGKSYMKYGVIGDVVNIAARLEQFNKQHGTSLLISSEVYKQLPADLQRRAKDCGDIELKGRAQRQQVYSL